MDKVSLGLIINIVLRLSILYFLGEVMLLQDDPRFAGKAIPIRNLIIVLSFSMLFPILYFWRKLSKAKSASGGKYPVWFDNLYLSIFWLDMAGNSFNLYDTYFYFDLIPHFHGTGALAAVLFGAFSFSALSAIGTANIIHMLLEAQEFYTDVFFKTHNVRGTFDVVNDMTIGIIGTIAYISFILLYRKFKK